MQLRRATRKPWQTPHNIHPQTVAHCHSGFKPTLFANVVKLTVKLARLPRESPSRSAPAAPSPPWARSSRPCGPCPGHAPQAAPRVGRRGFARRRRGIPRPRKERCAGARRDVVVRGSGGAAVEGAVARRLQVSKNVDVDLRRTSTPPSLYNSRRYCRGGSGMRGLEEQRGHAKNAAPRHPNLPRLHITSLWAEQCGPHSGPRRRAADGGAEAAAPLLNATPSLLRPDFTLARIAGPIAGPLPKAGPLDNDIFVLRQNALFLCKIEYPA